MAGLEAPQVEGRRRPLVIYGETDADAAYLIDLIASSNGYEVHHEVNGSNVLSLVEALLPDLLVLNLILAGEDGLEIIRRCRTSNQARVVAMPILVMDVHRRRDDIRKAFYAGADDYLEMPYDLSVMLRAWRRVCGFRRHPAPLSALYSDDGLVRQIALAVLTESPFSGVVAGLQELLHSPDPNLRAMAKWALRRVGTAESLALLNES